MHLNEGEKRFLVIDALFVFAKSSRDDAIIDCYQEVLLLGKNYLLLYMFYGTVEISRVITITHQSCLHKIKKNVFVQKQSEVATSVKDLDVMIVCKDVNLKLLIIIIGTLYTKYYFDFSE